MCCKVKYYNITQQHTMIGTGRELFCCHEHGVAFDKRIMALLKKAAHIYGVKYDYESELMYGSPFGGMVLMDRYIIEYGE